MSKLVPCSGCSRHVEQGTTCAFCGRGSTGPVELDFQSPEYRTITVYGAPPVFRKAWRIGPVVLGVILAAVAVAVGVWFLRR